MAQIFKTFESDKFSKETIAKAKAYATLENKYLGDLVAEMLEQYVVRRENELRK